MTDIRLQWHPAIGAAVQIELEQELSKIQIEAEHMLGKKPMQIDLLIIKKKHSTMIHKNIGHIFRMHNIIEYKSPDDYVSVNDFYKVYGYACFYLADTDRVGAIAPDELTITFITNAYPKNMINHIQKERKMNIKKYDEGIYYLSGDIFPIQIIVTKELSKKKNYWMQSLRNDLKSGGEIRELIKNYEDKKQNPLYQAVMEVITRANWKEVEEEKVMCDALKELFADELNESMKRGVERGIAESVLELLGELGEVPECVKTAVLEQKNLQVLKAWLRLAAKSSSIDFFQQRMY